MYSFANATTDMTDFMTDSALPLRSHNAPDSRKTLLDLPIDILVKVIKHVRSAMYVSHSTIELIAS